MLGLLMATTDCTRVVRGYQVILVVPVYLTGQNTVNVLKLGGEIYLLGIRMNDTGISHGLLGQSRSMTFG